MCYNVYIFLAQFSSGNQFRKSKEMDQLEEKLLVWLALCQA
jgi:hypothetical protein